MKGDLDLQQPEVYAAPVERSEHDRNQRGVTSFRSKKQNAVSDSAYSFPELEQSTDFPMVPSTHSRRKANRNKCLTSSNRCLTSSNKKLLVTRAKKKEF